MAIFADLEKNKKAFQLFHFCLIFRLGGPNSGSGSSRYGWAVFSIATVQSMAAWQRRALELGSGCMCDLMWPCMWEAPLIGHLMMLGCLKRESYNTAIELKVIEDF